VREFFQSAGMKHPAEVVPADSLRWRDKLRSRKKSAATVAFKLSVVRSFFEYLKAAGAVPLNPASTKLVSPPALPSERDRERTASPPPLPRVCAVQGGRWSSRLAAVAGRRRRSVSRSVGCGREGEGDVASGAGAGRMRETVQRDLPVRTQPTPPLFSLTLPAAAHILLLFYGCYSLSEAVPAGLTLTIHAKMSQR
jgi:hypothetical protein